MIGIYMKMVSSIVINKSTHETAIFTFLNVFTNKLISF